MSETSTSKNLAASEVSSAAVVESPNPDEASTSNQTLYDQALDILLLYVPDKDSAKQAIEATTPQDGDDAASWADAALCWLAQSKDLEAEQEALGTAMQVSLSEAEAQKASQVSHQQLDDQQVKARYSSSRILQQVEQHAAAQLLTLWQPPNRKHLLDLLELEMKACKWYPRSGTYEYFHQKGTQVAQDLSSGVSGSNGESNRTPASRRSILGNVTSVVVTLQCQLQELETVLYAMPETSGAAPKSFTDLDAQADSEVAIGEAVHHQSAMPCVDLD